MTHASSETCGRVFEMGHCAACVYSCQRVGEGVSSVALHLDEGVSEGSPCWTIGTNWRLFELGQPVESRQAEEQWWTELVEACAKRAKCWWRGWR